MLTRRLKLYKFFTRDHFCLCWLSLVVFILSITLALWVFWPVSRLSRMLFLPSLEEDVIVIPVSLIEPRLLTMEWPKEICLGEMDIVKLKFEIYSGNATTQSIDTFDISSIGQLAVSSESPDFYNVVAEVRFDMPGMIIEPKGAISKPVIPGKDLSFFWNLRPARSGNYPGTLWLYLNLVPREGGKVNRLTLMANPLQIEVASILGLQAKTARWVSITGILISLLVGFKFRDKYLRLLGRVLKMG